MSLWRQLTRGLRVVMRPGRADEDLRDEVEHYLEQAAAAHRARGLAPDAARRAAMLEMGNVTVTEEQVRTSGWEHHVDSSLNDLRYAWRRLRTDAGFTTVSGLTLALGIGASTAIFSAVQPILFESLPYPHAERIAMIWYGGITGTQGSQAFGTYRELAERSRSFEAIAVLKVWQPTLTGGAEPERLEGQRVSAAYLRVLGVAPAFGRDFDASEDRPGGARVALLSNALWRRHFGGDSAIVGKVVSLDGNAYTIVGVMPSSFENVLAPTSELWTLLQYDPSLAPDSREWGRHLRMVARLRAGVTIEGARRELATIARTPVPSFVRPGHATMREGQALVPLQADVTSEVRPALLAFIGAVLLVLAIACVNVTNLLLARGAKRGPELAMRIALGAERSRLIRQLLTESLVLALGGAVLGVVVAAIGVRALVALSPPDLPRLGAVHINGTALAFTLGITTVIGLAIGIVPALRGSRRDVRTALHRGASRTGTGHHRTRRTLVVVEVALAVVLLVSAGLLSRSLARLFAISPGFDPSRLLVMEVQATGPRFGDDAATRRFYTAALEAVRGVPGVDAAAFTSELPLSGEGQLEIYGVALTGTASRQPAFRYAVTPGYFEVMRIPLRRGRTFDPSDVTETAMRPVVINESFAKHAFSGRDPIGSRIKFGGPVDRPWDVIVGVVGDVKQLSLAVPRSDAVYVTTDQWLWADQAQWLVVRARGEAAALAPSIKRAIWSIDRDEPIVRVMTMDRLVAASEGQRRFALVVLAAFAAFALVLAATGIYGILAGSVAERVREIGVRSALGASPGDILRLIVRQGFTVTGVGVAIGVVISAATSRALATLLFGVSRLDTPTYAGVIAVLSAVALVACWAPARRAVRIDPSIALRAE